MKQLAIFDLDGTLFDTCRAHFLAYEAALNRAGRELDEDFFRHACFGHDFGYFGPLIAPGYGAEELEQLHREKIARYGDFLGQAKKNEHLFRLIRLMRGTYHTALVTAGSYENSRQILRAHGEEDSFDLILSAREIPRQKPDPIGFQMAMEHFGVLPEDTLIFEDSATGVAAAEAAGAQVLVVRNFATD
ncbi:MAG: HAD family phosphatase [Oscillospiraceae bacterium]|nr:HAD family phosphatase [Oscillospiraceae bacterium]